MPIYIFFDVFKAIDIPIPKGVITEEYYKSFGDNDIKPLWNGNTPTSFVIGLIVNEKELKYPFEIEDFKKELKNG